MSSGQLLCTRAAELGSAIACLQSATSSMRKNSRRLRTPDRVCLLQLVLGDVAEQLGLWKDPLLAGLPELGEAGKYLIELASTAGPTTAATGSGSSPNKTGAASPGAAGNGAPAAKAGGGEPLAGTLMGCLEEVSSVAAAAATAAAAVAEAAAPRHRPTPPAAAAGSDGHAAESDEESDDSEEDPLLVTLSDIYSVHRGVRGGTRNARMKAARIVPVQNRSFDLQGFEDFLQASGTCAADGSVPAAAAAAAAATATTGGLVDIPGSASGSRSSNRGAAAHDQGALYQQQLKLVQAQLTSCGMPAAGGAGMPMPADDAASEDGSFHSAEGAASPTPATPTGAAGAAQPPHRQLLLWLTRQCWPCSRSTQRCCRQPWLPTCLAPGQAWPCQACCLACPWPEETPQQQPRWLLSCQGQLACCRQACRTPSSSRCSR